MKSIEIAIIVVLGVASVDCGPKHRRPAGADPYADILKISSRSMTLRYYRGITNQEESTPTLPSYFPDKHRILMRATIKQQLAAFEDEIGEVTVLPTTHIWVESTWAPCGIPNGGACYTPQLIWAIGGDAYHIPHYYHELFHHYRWLLSGSVDPAHSHPDWSIIYRRQEQLNAQIRAQHLLELQLPEIGAVLPEQPPTCGCANSTH